MYDGVRMYVRTSFEKFPENISDTKAKRLKINSYMFKKHNL